jgi:hypothetical protein
MVTITPVSNKSFFVMAFLSRGTQEPRCSLATLGAPA